MCYDTVASSDCAVLLCRRSWFDPLSQRRVLYSQEAHYFIDKRFLCWLKREGIFCFINSFNSDLFKCMSLWRCGIVSSSHAGDPVSIPGVDAESYTFGKRIVQCGRQALEIVLELICKSGSSRSHS